MTSIQLGSIGFCLVLLAGCSEEQPPQTTQTPLTLNTENSSQVALKIPGVDEEIPEIEEVVRLRGGW